MKITFEVKKVDIKRGTVYCRTCPIALAITRIVRPNVEVSVFTEEIFFIETTLSGAAIKDNYSIPNNLKIRNFISKYDQGKNVKPTKFQLNIPDKYLLEKYTKK